MLKVYTVYVVCKDKKDNFNFQEPGQYFINKSEYR